MSVPAESIYPITATRTNYNNIGANLKYCIICLCVFFCVYTQSTFAQSSNEIDTFISSIKVKTYDCPAADSISQLDEYLISPKVSVKQKRQLRVQKAHWLICMGKHLDARELLDSLLAEPGFDKSSEAYASAHYQIGFIYDVQEDPTRCRYYAKAEQLAKDKFNDIYLSSQLGQITECSDDQSDGVKLGRLYALLEYYSNKKDNAAIAHIHNNIGIVYGGLGQHVLAAEQYYKSYELGLGEYQGTNQLATLISVITSQMASGDFTGAKKTIEEFKQVNLNVNTPQTNVWLHFAEAGYYYRTGNFDGLADSLAKWQVFLDEINSRTYTGLYRWYEAALCLHNENKECVEAFLLAEQQETEGYKNFVNRSKDYLRLQVEIQLFLGNVEAAKQQFELFADTMIHKTMSQQASGKILGVANLHNKVQSLESSLAEERQQRIVSSIALVGAFFIILVASVYFLRHRHLTRLASDPLTGLRNTRSVIEHIKRVDKPTDGKTNAIALFDLDNFKEVNSQFGHITGDRALQRVATTLKKVTREQDILGRLASEQFLVCLTNIEEQTAKTFFERIRQALENTILSAESGDRVNLHSSMSIYVSTDTFNDLEEVLADMQNALTKNNENMQ